MKRPRKKLRWTMAVASTSLLVLTIAAWVWSESHPLEELDLAIGLPSPKDWRHSLLIRKGEIIYYREDYRIDFTFTNNQRDPVWFDMNFPPTPWPLTGRRLLPWAEAGNFISLGEGSGVSADTIEIWVPLWIPALTFGLFACIGWHRLKRGKAGFCTKCRYDLRGLPKDSAVCPECGAKLPAASPPPSVSPCESSTSAHA